MELHAFDAVLFDLDGTLVATDRFWVQAARTGARRAFEELGLERPLPEAREWMALVGQPLDQGFAALFEDLEPAQRDRVQALCVEEEHRLLDAGGAAWMPGAEALLGALRAAGVRIGIASNCSQEYLDHMLDVLGVGRFAHEARCLDSPGVRSKADMIQSQLEVFGTRSAVFVGDRVGDRDAAWANAIPHVHCAFGFAGAAEEIEADAVIEDLGALPARLEARDAWIDRALDRAGLFLPSRRPPFAIGITGLPLAGKTLFARDAARRARRRGLPALAVELDWWRDPLADPAGSPLAGVDLEALEGELLAPLVRGEALQLEGRARAGEFDPEPGADGPPRLESGGIVFLAGEGLLDPLLGGRLERRIWLEVGEDEVLRRAAGREGRAQGPRPLEALRAGRLASSAAHAARYAPGSLADLVLPAASPLGRTTA